MFRKLLSLSMLLMLTAATIMAGERQQLWPKGKMPNAQSHQIGVMNNERKAPGFNPDKHRMGYIEWFDAPDRSVANGGIMVLISGGAYNGCVDIRHIENWRKRFTELGFQCVNLVYRTPRPVGLPYYQSAWEDGQRAIRMIRHQAPKRHLNPDRIGAISMSAGSHLALLLATSSLTPAYARIDATDDIPCNLNWAIVNAPAYVTTDADSLGTAATRQGYGPDVALTPLFKFDANTCPMSLHHGGNDIYSPNGSTLIYRQLRRMGVPAELHLYPGKPHGVWGTERGVEFMRQMGFIEPLAPEVQLTSRYPDDDARLEVIKETIWPEGKTPDTQVEQCEPYIEWHIPKTLKTKAIQIIYSGGSYMRNDPDGFEVAPDRRYLNQHGMTVVTMKYRTPRPSAESGLKKHITAWQDLQRAIRIVRHEAASRGLSPDSIGIMGTSAGGHLTLMGATSSLQRAYLPIDAIDTLSCAVQWAVAVYPAYALTDGLEENNTTGGNADTAILAPEFNFDLHTSPILFMHGDSDPWAAMNSVKAWEHLRAMGIQCELHTLATRKHCFQRQASPGTGSYTYQERIADFLRETMNIKGI